MKVSKLILTVFDALDFRNIFVHLLLELSDLLLNLLGHYFN